MDLDQSQLFDILRATGIMGGGGGGFGGGGAPTAEAGDYVVAITVDGNTQRQMLRVERAASASLTSYPFELEEMMKAYERWMRTQH
jgi:hypothetical protein